MTDSAHYVRMLHPPMVVGGGGRGRKEGKERGRYGESSGRRVRSSSYKATIL